MSIEDILAEVQSEGSPVELDDENKDQKETETPSDSPADIKPTEEAPSQEGAKPDDGDSGESSASKGSIPDESNSIPFNKHPRWQEKLDRIAELESEKGQFLSKIEDLEKRFNELTSQKPTQQQETIPAWFSNVWGDDRAAWEEAKRTMSSGGVSPDQVASLVREEISRKEREAQESKQRETAWVKDSFKKIEDKFGVSLPEGSDERNEFVNWVLKIRPTTDDGTSIDLVRGYDAWREVQELKKASRSESVQAKKKVASMTTDERATPPSRPASLDPEKVRSMSFRELALQAAIDEGIIQ